ncbi:MAG: phycobilisome protein [Pseudanabaenaceae cyanobacterium]
MELSTRARALLPLAHMPDLAVLPDVVAIADREGRFLTDAELAQLPERYRQEARILREQASVLVDRARGEVLARFPGIAAPGGDLYPETRAAACWRDLWHFLRCIAYTVAADRPDAFDEPGLAAMAALYRELRVPLPAMVVGVQALQHHSPAPLALFFAAALQRLQRFA